MEYVPFPLEVYPPAVKGEDYEQEFQRQFTQRLFNDYWEFPIDKAHTILEEKDAKYWEVKGLERALDLFHAASERIPAYKDFLKKNNINPSLIQTAGDFKQVPPINKKNYLQLYPLEELLWDGQMHDSQMVAVSSGSSGEPFFWPRSGLLELETTYIQELYLKKIFQIDQYSTLYINCFAMGMYIGGPIILNSALRVSQKGYPMTVVTPGLSMDDIMRVIPNLGPNFEQIILAGYPPYIKDIVEEGIKAGVEWNKYKVGMLLAGEGFSEEWRDYVGQLVGSKNIQESIINIYGTADASIVGHETPESIILRRFIDQDEGLQERLLKNRYPGRLPTLVQYIPTQKYFEVIDNELHFTATSGIPLIRYNIHDDGGIITYSEAMKACSEKNVNIEQVRQKETPHAPSWKLPFVYLYGRSDSTVVLYGANIYPENIKSALEVKDIRDLVTGRFVMTIEYDEKQSQYLRIRIELREGVEITNNLEKRIQEIMTKTLLDVNDEYRSSYRAKGHALKPIIVLHSKGDSDYFTRVKNKQKWTDNKK